VTTQKSLEKIPSGISVKKATALSQANDQPQDTDLPQVSGLSQAINLPQTTDLPQTTAHLFIFLCCVFFLFCLSLFCV
jgi:hypothetical protein